jgi:hypothetical protein
MATPSAEPGFLVRTFVRPLLTPGVLALKVPGMENENVLMALAKRGNLSWPAPGALKHKMLNEAQGKFGSTPMGISLTRHPDRTPSEMVTAENLLNYDDPESMTRRPLIAVLCQHNQLDKLEIKPEFSHLAGRLRYEVDASVRANKHQLGQEPELRHMHGNPESTDKYYQDRIASGERWMAKLDAVFPPAPDVPKVKVSSLDAEPPAIMATKETAKEAGEMPEVAHLPRASLPYGITGDHSHGHSHRR